MNEAVFFQPGWSRMLRDRDLQLAFQGRYVEVTKLTGARVTGEDASALKLYVRKPYRVSRINGYRVDVL
jgi:hypothetical protein